MRPPSSGFRGKNLWCATVAALALFLGGCSEDPGLQERLNRLQAEMQEKDRQLQEAQSALEKTKSELKTARAVSANKPAAASTPASTPHTPPPFLSRERVEESYGSASNAMQNRVATDLRNYSVESCTQFPVVMPSDEYPYHSKVALAIRSDSGHSYRLEFPVSADATGKWIFPTSAEIAGALADSRAQETMSNAASNATPAPTSSPRTALANTTPAPTIRPTSPDLVPGQTANETRTINWGSPHPVNNNVRPTSTPITSTNVRTSAREGQQPSPSVAQPMQSDRDVRIHW